MPLPSFPVIYMLIVVLGPVKGQVLARTVQCGATIAHALCCAGRGGFQVSPFGRTMLSWVVIKIINALHLHAEERESYSLLKIRQQLLMPWANLVV